MNNKIKPLLMVIAVAVIISVINVSASASDERLSEAKNLIYAISCGNIDITENDEEVNKTDEITRSEFVMHAVELFGKNASASETVSFKDVDSESELYNALCKAVSMQMVTDSEAFRPEDAVTLNEAVKMLCVVTGFGKRAEALGGFPSGYLRVATEIKLLNNVGKSVDKDSEAMLFYNALVTNIATEEAYEKGSDGEVHTHYVADGNDNLLKRLYDVCVTEGKVNANEYTQLGNEETENSDGRYEIDGIRYELQYKKANAFLGYNVYAYYTIEQNEIIFVQPRKNKTVTLNSWECEYNPEKKTIYCDSNGKNFSLDLGFDYIYNGKTYYGYGENIIPENGIITLVDSNNDNKYDVVSAENVYYLNVAAANAVYKVISDSFDKEKSLDLSDNKCRFFISGAEENELSISDLEADMILAVKASKDKSLVYIKLCEESVSGIYTGLDTDKHTITVDDEEYRLGFEFEKTYLSSMLMGAEYSFILGINNEIVAFVASKDIYKYGYVIKTGAEGRLNTILNIKLYTQEGKFVILECDKNIRLNGVKCDMEALEAIFVDQFGETDAQLIRYRLNKDGKIINIDISAETQELNLLGTGTPDDCLESFSAGAPWYYRQNIFYPNFNVKGTIIFCVPSKAENLDDEKYFKIGHSFKDGTYDAQAVIPYNIGQSGSAKVLVYKSNEALAINADNNSYDIMMIEKAFEGVDKEGNWRRKVIGWQNGKFKEMFLDDNVEIHKSNGKAVLEGGDVIRYNAIGDLITTLSVDFIGQTLSVNTHEENSEVPEFNVRSAISHYQSGKVYTMSEGYVYLYDDDYSFEKLRNAAIPSTIGLYDFETKKIRTVDSNYLKNYISNGESSGFMLIKQHYQYSESGFFYINR